MRDNNVYVNTKFLLKSLSYNDDGDDDVEKHEIEDYSNENAINHV